MGKRLQIYLNALAGARKKYGKWLTTFLCLALAVTLTTSAILTMSGIAVTDSQAVDVGMVLEAPDDAADAEAAEVEEAADHTAAEVEEAATDHSAAEAEEASSDRAAAEAEEAASDPAAAIVDAAGPSSLSESTASAVHSELKAAEEDPYAAYSVAGTLENTMLATDGRTYRVSVGYDESAMIPDGAVLTVKEIPDDDSAYSQYVDQAAEALGTGGSRISCAKLFDITISKDGEEIQPASPVDVCISMLSEEVLENENQPETSAKVLHFGEEVEVLDGVTDTVELENVNVSFRTEGFSVYGIVYTVDFHWAVDGEVFSYSIEGGTGISLRDLISLLHIYRDDPETEEDELKAFIDGIAEVRFSNPDLAWAGRVRYDNTIADIKEFYEFDCQYTEGLTDELIEELDSREVYAGEWGFVSLQPFTSEEELTVVMKDGESFVIKVTDAQISADVLTASGETYTITVTFDDDAEIPVGTRLIVREIEPGTDEFMQQLVQAWTEVNKEYLEQEAYRNSLPDETDDNKDIRPVNLENARFFDITLLYNGEPIEPKASVHVDIQYKEGLKTDAEEMISGVVHFKKDEEEGEKIELIKGVETKKDEKGEIVEFIYEQDGFSIVGTFAGQETKDGGPLSSNPSINLQLLNSQRSGTSLGIPVAKKNLDPNEDKEGHPDGTYTLSLSVTGQALESESLTKANVLFIMDRSSSMTGNVYEKHEGSPVSGVTYYGQNDIGSFITLSTYNGRYYQYYPTPYTGQVFTKTSTTRLAAEQKAMRTLVNELLQKNDSHPGTVEISIISFADTRGDRETTTSSNGTWNTAVTETEWNSDPDTLLAAINAEEVHSGTNWEEALKYAQDKINELPEDRKEEKTYVIFLTDGEPTAISGETGGAHHYDNDNGQPIYNGILPEDYTTTNPHFPYNQITYHAGDHYDGVHNYLGGFGYAYEPARDDARNIVKAGYDFYSVMTFNPLISANRYLKRLTNYAYDYDGDGVGGDAIDSDDDVDTDGDILNNYYFNASTPEELTNAFQNIFKAVSNSIAHGQVKITDGMTAGAMTSTFVSGSPNGVRYIVSKKGENDEDVELYSVTAEKNPNDEDNPIVTFHINGEDYSTTDTGDRQVKKITNPDSVYDKGTYYSITVNNVEYKMALASIVKKSDTEDTLTWDLTPIGTLWGDCTYTAEFIVWPNQDAYDYVAALNNGLEEIINSKNQKVDVNWNHSNAVPVLDPTTNEVNYYKGGCEDYPSIVYYPAEDDVYENGVYNGVFAVLTNTEQYLDYSVVTKENGEVTGIVPQDQIPLETPKPMKLTAAGSRVSKLWNISRDPDALLRLLYEFEGNTPKVDEEGRPIPKQYMVPVLDPETGEPVIDAETGDPVTEPHTGFFIDFKILQDTSNPAADAYKTVRLGWDDDQGKYVWYEGDEESQEDYVKSKTYDLPSGPVTLTYGIKWEQDFSIATGLMLSHDLLIEKKLDPNDYAHGKYPHDDTGKEYYLLEDGHDYTLSEPDLGYEFDFDAPTYHPMLVDGVMKSVRFTKTGDTISISEIEDLEISTDGMSLLEIFNTLRGYIHVKKMLIADPEIDTSEDETKFTFNVNLYNDNGAFIEDGAHIPWYGINELFYHTEVENLEGEKEYEYYQAHSIGMAEDGVHGLLTLTDEDGNTYTATCDGKFDEDAVGPTAVTFDVDGEPLTIPLYGNQMGFDEVDKIEDTNAYRKVHATFMITKDQTLNIANVPVSTRYDITESDERGYEFVSLASTASAETDGKRITGTIIQNSDTTVTYTNKALSADLQLKKLVRVNEFDPQGGKVSSDDKTKADGTYTITVTGKEETETEGKSYEVKIAVDNTGNSTVYTLSSFADNSTASEGDGEGESSAVNPVSAVLLEDGTVLLKNLPFGEYTVTEAEPDSGIACVGVYCSDYSISPNVNDRTVGIEVKPGETEDKAKLVQYTNNLTNTGDDIAHVSVRKTFVGLDPSKIPEDFKVNVTVRATIDGVQRTFSYVLTGSDEQQDGVVFNSAVVDGNVVWNWRIAIAGLKPDAILTVEEEGYDRTGYDVTPSVNGHYGTDFNGTVSASTVVLDMDVGEVFRPNNRTIFPVSDMGTYSEIFMARLTSDQTTLVISKNRLTLSEKAKIEYALKHNMSQGGDWTHGGNDVMYFNFEEAGSNQIHVKGADITYRDTADGGEIEFKEKCQWTMVGLSKLIYQPGRPADVNFVNQYMEDAVTVEIIKFEMGSVPVKKLSGAVFTLKQLEDEAPTLNGTLHYVDGFEKTSPKTNDKGETAFTGLTHGYYELSETTVPKGYLRTGDLPVYFKIEDGVVTYLQKSSGRPSTWLAAENSDSIIFTAAREEASGNPSTPENEAQAAANASFTIGNEPGAELPAAGGPGTDMYKFLGLLLTIGAGILLLI